MIAESVKRKKEGFGGQKAIVIPRKILISQCERNDITGALYITDINGEKRLISLDYYIKPF